MSNRHSISARMRCLLLALSLLGGCALDAPLTRSEQQQRVQLTGKQLEVANHPKCCDDLTKASPWVMLTRGTANIVPVGSWPNERVVEIDGFRSFYALIALSEPARGGEKIWIESPAAARSYLDPVTGNRNGDVFYSTVTFLDSARAQIRTVLPEMSALPGRLGIGGDVELPKGAAFLVLHSSQKSLQKPAQWATFGGGTTVLPAGKVGLLPMSTPSMTAQLYPALSGMVHVIQSH